jgi:hypothetical protein
MLSHLVQAQALGILLEQFAESTSIEAVGAEIGEILEDIGNLYLDLSEDIATARSVAPTEFA